MTDQEILEGVIEQREGAMALMFEERARAVKLRDTLLLLRNHTSMTTNQIEIIDDALKEAKHG